MSGGALSFDSSSAYSIVSATNGNCLVADGRSVVASERPKLKTSSSPIGATHANGKGHLWVIEPYRSKSEDPELSYTIRIFMNHSLGSSQSKTYLSFRLVEVCKGIKDVQLLLSPTPRLWFIRPLTGEGPNQFHIQPNYTSSSLSLSQHALIHPSTRPRAPNFVVDLRECKTQEEPDLSSVEGSGWTFEKAPPLMNIAKHRLARRHLGEL